MVEVTIVDADSIEDPALLQEIEEHQNRMSLHGEYFKTQGEYLDAAHEITDLSTRLSKTAEYPSDTNEALTNLSLSILGAPDLQSLKEKALEIKEDITKGLSNIRERLNQWRMTCEKLIASTEKRCEALLEEAKHYDNSRNDKILAATSTNIKLAEALFTERTGVQGVLEGLSELKEVCFTLLSGPISKDLDGAVEHLLSMFMKHEDQYDTSFIAEYHSACKDVTKSTKTSPSGVISHYSAPLFEGKHLVLSGPEPEHKMALHDLYIYSKEFAIGLQQPSKAKKATEDTWAHFSLPCLTSMQAVAACQLVNHIVMAAKAFTPFINNHAATCQKIIQMSHAQGVDNEAKQLAQIATRFWKEIVFGCHSVLEHALKVCNNVLTYVARSVSTWEHFKANSNASDILKNTAKMAGLGAAAGAIIGAKSRPDSDDDLEPEAKQANAIMHKVGHSAAGAAMGAVGGLLTGGVMAHRRKSAWDAKAKAHHQQTNED